MTLRLARSVVDRLIAEAAMAHPHECCGLLLGGAAIDGVMPAANLSPDSARAFEIDPAALIAAHKAARSGGPQVLGYYHSHPHGPAEPSAIDRAGAARDGRVWAIVARGAVRLWVDGLGGFEPLSYCIVEG